MFAFRSGVKRLGRGATMPLPSLALEPTLAAVMVRFDVAAGPKVFQLLQPLRPGGHDPGRKRAPRLDFRSLTD